MTSTNDAREKRAIIAATAAPRVMEGRIYCFFQAEDGIRGHCVTGVQTCALPIWGARAQSEGHLALAAARRAGRDHGTRSEEHTSELQSHSDLVCRLLLEKKK